MKKMTSNGYPDISIEEAEQRRKNGLGKILEKWIFAILKILFPANLGFRIIHPDWSDNYNNDHKGVDFRVFLRCKEILALECKNWRRLANKYGKDIVERDIIPRFDHIGTSVKICAISFLDVLTNPAIQHTQSQGIQFIDIGKLIGRKDFRTPLFHVIKDAVSRLIVQPARRVLEGSIQSQLPIPVANTVSSVPNTVVNRSKIIITKVELNNTVSDNNSTSDKLEELIVKPTIAINHPCQIGHPDHEAWLRRMMEQAERYG